MTIAEKQNLFLNLKKLEQQCNGNSTLLDECENFYKQCIQEMPSNSELLSKYNQFRLRNIDKLPPRPKVLLGGKNNTIFPDLRTYALLRVADVVAITTESNIQGIDRAYFNIATEGAQDILKRLPQGFTPDFFFISCR